MAVSQSILPITDAVLKDALFQCIHEQVSEVEERREPFVTTLNNSLSVGPGATLPQPASAALVSSVMLTMHSCRASFPAWRMGFSDTIS